MAAADGLIPTGAALYQRYCALCHGKDATGYAADNAPSLVTQTFLESAGDAFIAHAIIAGRPSTAMGAYGQTRGGPLDNTGVEAIVRFLRSHGPLVHGSLASRLPGGAAIGNAEHGSVIYGRECAPCHGTETERKTALSLFNAELLSSATPAFLRYAIVHGRAPTPMPAFGEKLTGGDIEDVLSFLSSKAPKPAAAASAPPEVSIPKNLPVVINPKGKPPTFALREDRFVPAADVKKALAEHRRLVIVDARSPSDWLDFHIPGAIPAPYYAVKDLDRIPNDGTWVIAYCACPHHASGAVVDALRRKNYKHTAVLDEGILFWKAQGYPLDGQTKQ